MQGAKENQEVSSIPGSWIFNDTGIILQSSKIVSFFAGLDFLL
jgi:hypothetical protein